jgi:hypothetical protein
LTPNFYELPPAQPAGQEAPLGRTIPKGRIAGLSAVSPPPTIQHSALHAENAGSIYFFNRLRIADVRPSIHFIADDFLRFALKPACPLWPKADISLLFGLMGRRGVH